MTLLLSSAFEVGLGAGVVIGVVGSILARFVKTREPSLPSSDSMAIRFWVNAFTFAQEQEAKTLWLGTVPPEGAGPPTAGMAGLWIEVEGTWESRAEVPAELSLALADDLTDTLSAKGSLTVGGKPVRASVGRSRPEVCRVLLES